MKQKIKANTAQNNINLDIDIEFGNSFKIDAVFMYYLF